VAIQTVRGRIARTAEVDRQLIGRDHNVVLVVARIEREQLGGAEPTGRRLLGAKDVEIVVAVALKIERASIRGDVRIALADGIKFAHFDRRRERRGERSAPGLVYGVVTVARAGEVGRETVRRHGREILEVGRVEDGQRGGLPERL
jgi:hypothetical protein